MLRRVRRFTNVAAMGNASVGLPTLAYINQYATTYASKTQSATATIPAAGSNTLAVVIFYDNQNGYSGPATATINGVSATVTAEGASGAFSNIGIAYALVASGVTSVPIAVTYANTPGFGGSFVVYTINGLSSTIAVGSNTAFLHGGSTSPLSTTLATSSGGVVIVGSFDDNSGQSPTYSGTETYVRDVTFSPSGTPGAGAAHATGTATNASSTVTSTWTPSGTNNSLISAVSFR